MSPSELGGNGMDEIVEFLVRFLLVLLISFEAALVTCAPFVVVHVVRSCVSV